MPIRIAVEQFYQVFIDSDVQIVAAAGNDGPQEDGNPHPARYPAAFENVLGVGAIERDGTRAGYSNLADNLPSDGVVVFGGKGNPHVAQRRVNGNPPKKWSRTDAADGILGLYVGKFPVVNPITGEIDRNSSTPSAHGWGRWSGTSFASAVMSGILAAAAAGGCTISLQKSGSIIETLRQDSPERTEFDELIINVQQG